MVQHPPRSCVVALRLVILAAGAKWQKKVYCNAVEVTVNIEARTVEHAYEVIVNVGGYAPVLQRELHATVLMQVWTVLWCPALSPPGALRPCRTTSVCR